jgi:hypothetical protein
MRVSKFFIFILFFSAFRLYAPQEPDNRLSRTWRLIYRVFPFMELLHTDYEHLFNALGTIYYVNENEDEEVQPMSRQRGLPQTLVTINPAEPA